MVSPPEAEPVSAASTLVATASETSGPPPIPSTASRTAPKGGMSATTAPNPTELATLTAGSTDAFAPASMVARRAGSRRWLTARTVAIAQARAVTTAQTPPTAARDVPPQRGSARNEVSSDGKINIDIAKLTATTTTSGNAESRNGGGLSVAFPRTISGGSNSRAVVA